MTTRGRGRKAFDKKTIRASFTGHLTGLPQDILSLFQPSPPLTYLPPIKTKEDNSIQRLKNFQGIATFVCKFNKSKNTDTPRSSGQLFFDKWYRNQVRIAETHLERLNRKKNDKYIRTVSLNNASKYDPSSDPNIEGNPYKTLFVARLSYNITEQRLRKEFEEFGSVLKIRIIDNKLSGKPRGYAFIEYERLEDMKRAYKIGMNRKIEGRSIVVDVERGRTVADWRPRRLGGGLGGENRHARPKKMSSESQLSVRDTFKDKQSSFLISRDEKYDTYKRNSSNLSSMVTHRGFPKDHSPNPRARLTTKRTEHSYHRQRSLEEKKHTDHKRKKE